MAQTVQEQKQQAHQDAERRRSKVVGELAKLVRERGHEVVAHEEWGRLDVDEHSIASISIDTARRRSDFEWVCALRFKITHNYRQPTQHYPEPTKGWEDAKLRQFADMIHEEVGARSRSEQREDELRELKEAMSQQAAAINAELGVEHYGTGHVSVDPRGAFCVRMPSDLNAIEAKMLALFARWLNEMRETDPLLEWSNLGELRDDLTVNPRQPYA